MLCNFALKNNEELIEKICVSENFWSQCNLRTSEEYYSLLTLEQWILENSILKNIRKVDTEFMIGLALV